MPTKPIPLAAFVAAILVVCGLLSTIVISGCSPSTTTLVAGDRDVTQITAGELRTGRGDVRNYYILRDPDTGIDYLAVVDAGIIEMKPKPAQGVERGQ